MNQTRANWYRNAALIFVAVAVACAVLAIIIGGKQPYEAQALMVLAGFLMPTSILAALLGILDILDKH